MVSHFLSTLLLLGSLVLPIIAGGHHDHTCLNPKVRKEWRKLSEYEKTDWIRAVKVPISVDYLRRVLTVSTQCLGTIPHDPKFTPTVPANISMIPPVAQNSSFYDGSFRLNPSHSDAVH